MSFFQKKIHFPVTPFNLLIAAWLVSLVVNILFSDAPAVSLLSLSFLSFLPINSPNAPLNSLNSPALPLSPSWLVALSSFGASFKNVFLGVGLGNFSNAFTQFRPASFNTNALWFFRFKHAASPALTILVEQGLLGIFFWLFLFYQIYRLFLLYPSYERGLLFNMRENRFVKGFFVLVVFWFLVFLLPLPALIFPIISLLSLISLFMILILFSKKRLHGFRLIPFPFIVLPISLITLISLISLSVIFTLRFSPDRFVAQSQMALVSAEKTAKDKPNDKKTIQKQIAASLSSANQAINLNPKNAAYQTNLAVIAVHLNNILTDAPRLATDHFRKAVALDPANPQLFFEIGRFYFTQGDLYVANQNFATAAALKNDYVPAWFAVYQTEKKLSEDAAVSGNVDLQKKHEENAKSALETVEQLVCTDDQSEDCKKVKKEGEGSF